jgi:MAPEG family protein
VIHTFVYAKGIQPARAICFAVGALCTLLMIFRIVVNVM